MSPLPLTLGTRQHRILMGVRCEVSVIGGNVHTLAEEGLRMVADLEQLWSRFIPSSDICRLNRADGEPVWVDGRTVALIGHMIAAHTATQGAYNPTLLPALIQHGDTRSLIDDKTSTVPALAHAFTDISGIIIRADNTVTIPAHMTLDAGGLGKGFAADLIADHLISRGAESVCVNLGGDIRVARTPDTTHAWPIHIMSPSDATQSVCTISLAQGAVATSHTAARQRNGQGITCHIASPNGSPIPFVAASVIASTAAWAEAWTKFALQSNDTLIEKLGLVVLRIDESGAVTQSDTWQEFLQ
jgi:thiamine biosynthesis lipoprotein